MSKILGLGLGLSRRSVAPRSSASVYNGALTAPLTLDETWPISIDQGTPTILSGSTSFTIKVRARILTGAEGVVIEAGATTSGTMVYCFGGNIYARGGTSNNINPEGSIEVSAPIPNGTGILEVSLSATSGQIYWNGRLIGSGVSNGTVSILSGTDNGGAGRVFVNCAVNRAGWTSNGQGVPNAQLSFSEVSIYEGEVIAGGEESTAYFAAAEAVDANAFDLTATNATYTATYTKAGHDALFKVLKGEASLFDTGYGTKPTASDVYAKIDHLMLWAGVRSLSALAVKAKGSGSNTLVNFVSGDYKSVGTAAGLVGDGSSKYVNPAITYDGVLSNKSLGAYESAVPIDPAQRVLIGDTVNFTQQMCNITSGSVNVYLGTSYLGAQTRVAPKNIIVSFRSHTDREAFFDGVSVATNTFDRSPLTVTPGSIFIFASNSPGLHSDARQIANFFGQGLTAAEMTYLSWCINAWATYFGTNTYTNP